MQNGKCKKAGAVHFYQNFLKYFLKEIRKLNYENGAYTLPLPKI